MYINRTEPRAPVDSASRKSIVSRRGQGEAFADTMSSVIEVDVVEVGDHEEEKRRQQTKKDEQKEPPAEQPAEQQAGKSSLDIKA